MMLENSSIMTVYVVESGTSTGFQMMLENSSIMTVYVVESGTSTGFQNPDDAGK